MDLLGGMAIRIAVPRILPTYGRHAEQFIQISVMVLFQVSHATRRPTRRRADRSDMIRASTVPTPRRPANPAALRSTDRTLAAAKRPSCRRPQLSRSSDSAQYADRVIGIEQRRKSPRPLAAKRPGANDHLSGANVDHGRLRDRRRPKVPTTLKRRSLTIFS